jgi:hypothetical protein
MKRSIREFIIIAAGIACAVLGLVVILGHPVKEDDFLAWIGIAAAVGFIAIAVP